MHFSPFSFIMNGMRTTKTQNCLRALPFFLPLFLALVFFAVLPALSLAATGIPTSPSVISIEVIPEVPGPFERATLVLTSYTADLDRSLIIWSINGKEAQRGIGKRNFSFVLGGVGSVSVVRADVQTSTLGTITNTLTFNPGYVDVLWEATDSYVPPFYKGKALPASQANMRLTAVPTMVSSNGNLFAPESLVYNWKQDFKYSEFYDQSGFNKRFVTFQKNMLLGGEFIQVEVSSLYGKDGARGEISIGQYSPKILLYRDNPLTGIDYAHTLSGTASLQNQETSIVAEPFYFSSIGREGGLSFVWRLNSKTLPGDEGNKSHVVFRQEGGTSGAANLSVETRSSSRILQFAQTALSLVFNGNNGPAPAFGL